jgi:hypothetical protein
MAWQGKDKNEEVEKQEPKAREERQSGGRKRIR